LAYIGAPPLLLEEVGGGFIRPELAILSKILC